jgi:hypothetical protein
LNKQYQLFSIEIKNFRITASFFAQQHANYPIHQIRNGCQWWRESPASNIRMPVPHPPFGGNGHGSRICF